MLIFGFLFRENEQFARNVIDNDVQYGTDGIFDDQFINVQKRYKYKFRAKAEQKRENARCHKF